MLGHPRHASETPFKWRGGETPFKWRFAGGPMMARFYLFIYFIYLYKFYDGIWILPPLIS